MDPTFNSRTEKEVKATRPQGKGHGWRSTFSGARAGHPDPEDVVQSASHMAENKYRCSVQAEDLGHSMT